MQDETNFTLFRDCLSAVLVEQLAPKEQSVRQTGREKRRRKRAATGVESRADSRHVVSTTSDRSGEDHDSARDVEDENVASDAAQLGDFTNYLAEEIFAALPKDIQTLSHVTVQEDPNSEWTTTPLTLTGLEKATATLPPSISESLLAYGAASAPADLDSMLRSVLEAYIAAATATPSELTLSKPSNAACEICERDHLPLTYHHLIPRSVQAKALKRGWHREWELQKVAWLCRACHSFVHRIASNEELAREWHEIERLLERDDVRRWAKWVGRVRWKAH